MIRIRPGRSWRLNPAYQRDLRELARGPLRRFTGEDVLDVLGIEVEGIDIAAGLGEARVLHAVDELARALLHLGDGDPAAQATVGPGPAELVLEARGADVALTLVSLAPPERLLASGLVVDGSRLREATAHAADAVLDDLVSIGPALRGSSLARRLERAARMLREPARRRPRRWPGEDGRARNVSARSEGLSLGISLPAEAMARLGAGRRVPRAPLAPHLWRSRIRLAADAGPGLEIEAAPLLLLRALLRGAAAVVEAWESGEPRAVLPFGPHELRLDLAREELRAPGWKRPAHASAAALARLAADAARKYALLSRSTPDDPATDLVEAAEELLRHLADVESGDLRRDPEAIASPPRREPSSGPEPRLGRGSVRRLVFREVWSAPVEGARHALLAPGIVLLDLGSEIAALEGGRGRELWRRPAAAPLFRGSDIVYVEHDDALVRADAQTGVPRWKRRIRGAAAPEYLRECGAGILRPLPGEGLALVSDTGALVFRAALPGGAPLDLASAGATIVVALSRGLLAGLDPANGHLVWKRRAAAGRIVPTTAGVLVASAEALSLIEPATGGPLWERPLPEDAGDPCASVEDAVVLAGRTLTSWSLATGAPSSRRIVAAIEEGGDEDDPARLSQIRRGIALVHGSATFLIELSGGREVARLPPAAEAALAGDLSCALVTDEGASLHRLATHLSLV